MDYNTRGLMTSRTDAAGKTTILAYNSQDLVETVKDANNNITSYLYNERGQVTRVTYPGAVSVNYAYDTYGNQTARTDELSATGLPTDIDHTWSATFDEFKRRTTATTPRRSAADTLPRTTTYAYDEPTGGGGCCGTAGAGDHLTTITLPSGKVTRFVYDLAWQKTAEITGYGSPDVATTQYFYNASGNMYQMIDANSKTTDYSYDLRNRRLTATDLLGQITRWTYDGVGSVLTVTRPAPVGGVTVNTYDTMNRLSTTTDPASQLTQYFYGGLNYVGGTKGDNLVRLKDARLNSHDFTYDAMNRKTSMIYPGGSHEDWGYDNVGNNNTYKNRAALTKTISYDTRNRETGFTWSDGSTPAVARTYDNASRLLTLNNANSALTYTYDFSGQLTGETQNVSGLGAKTVGYSYDADGNRATMTYPGGKVAGYTYTGRNQVDTITYDGPPPLVNYDYDLAGNRSLKTLENGTRTAYAYDDAERLTGVDHQRSSGGAWTSFQSFGYTLSSVGNRTDRYETNAGLTKRDKYSYLADDQLDIVKYNYTGTTQDRTVDYNYDAVGSRTTVADSAGQTPGTYAPNTLNQYTSVNGAGQGFDSNGNQTMVYLGSGSSPSYFTYDAQNRATSGYGMVPGGYNSMSLAYDARNRCVKRTSSGSSGMTTTYLVWDGWNLLAEFAGGSGYSYPPPPATELRRYVHGAVVDEILLAIAPSAAQTVHHVHDALGNVTALTDASGAVVERYTYDVFGKATVLNASGTALAGTAYGNRFLFTGREWIAELAVYDCRNRVYSASMGRFLQTDPIRFDGDDCNLYRYVNSSVANLVDPYGLKAAAPKYPNPCTPGEKYDMGVRRECWHIEQGDFHGITTYCPAKGWKTCKQTLQCNKAGTGYDPVGDVHDCGACL